MPGDMLEGSVSAWCRCG